MKWRGSGALVAAALAWQASSCAPAAPEDLFPGRHLILISLDTTRADHLGCYGSPGARTPVLDSLARRGILFADAVTAAPTTLASHTTVMTGLHPHSHGVPENGWTVARANTLLAEILREAGYRTAGVAGSFALARRFGIDQGFQVWDERFDLLLHPMERDQNQRRAAAVTDAALAAVDGPAEGGDEAPLFLFVHYFDPHAPYDPPAGHRPPGIAGTPGLPALRALVARHQASAGAEPRGLQVVFHGLTPGLLEPGPAAPGPEDRLMEALYAGEISYMDAEIGRLLAGLEERGILQEAVVLIFGDHGETLWEHGDYYNHGLALYQTTLHVPLILALPGGRHAGAVVRESVSTVDILPTLLGLLGLEGPGRLEGMDLAPLLRQAGAGAERPLFAEATQPGDESFDPGDGRWRNLERARMVRLGRWKLIHTPYLDAWELFDLESDPGERHNLMAGGRPATAGAAEAAGRLRSLLEDWAGRANPMPSFPSLEHIEEVRDRLRSLGYL